MATRLYFPSTGTPDISPTINNGGEWEHSNGVRRPLVATVGSSALSTDSYAPDAADHLTNGDALIYQYVLTNKLSAHTISGQTVKWQFQCLEAHANNNLFLTLKIFVCGNDGTIKETLLAIRRDATEVATSLTNRGDSATISSATVEDNDRIVVEIGLGGTPSATGGVQGHNGSIRFGESASSGDLPEDDSTTTTTYRPWLEFANTLALNQTVTQSSAFTNSASFYAGTVSPGSVTVTQSSSYTNSSAFYAGAVSLTTLITQESGLTNDNVFYGHAVTPGSAAITQDSKHTNTPSFFGVGVLPGAVTVSQEGLYSNLYEIYSGAVTAGGVTVAQDSTYINEISYFGGLVTGEGGQQTITASAVFESNAVWYGGAVAGDAVDDSRSWLWVTDNTRHRNEARKKAKQAKIAQPVAAKIIKEIEQKLHDVQSMAQPEEKTISDILRDIGVKYSPHVSEYANFVWMLINQQREKKAAQEKGIIKAKHGIYMESKEQDKRERAELMFLLDVIDI